MTQAAAETKTDAKPKKLEEIRIVKKEFSFPLTEEDFAKKAKVIAELNAQLNEAEYAFEQHKSAFKAAESRIEASIAHEIRAIRSKQELREVECEQVSDFVRKVVYWRFDSKQLGERAMYQAELQPALVPDDKTKQKTEKGEKAAKGWDKLDDKAETPAHSLVAVTTLDGERVDVVVPAASDRLEEIKS